MFMRPAIFEMKSYDNDNACCLSFDETQLLGKPWQLQHSREKQPLWKLFSGVRVHSRMHVREEKQDVDCLSLAFGFDSCRENPGGDTLRVWMTFHSSGFTSNIGHSLIIVCKSM